MVGGARLRSHGICRDVYLHISLSIKQEVGDASVRMSRCQGKEGGVSSGSVSRSVNLLVVHRLRWLREFIFVCVFVFVFRE